MEQPQAAITTKVQQINLKETLDKRFCDLAFSLLGKQVKVRLPDNKEGEGIFYTINPNNGGVMVKNYKEQANCYPGEPGYNSKQNQNDSNATKCFHKQDFIYLFAENVDEPPFIQDFQQLKNNKALKTDGELTKLDKNRGRKFQAVDFIFGEDSNLEDGDDLNAKPKPSSFKNLDQFQINQQKFGVGTDFKDEYYTTKLDMTKLNKEQIEFAEKLEQEVVKEGSKHKHVLIDRGRDDLLADSDEEKHFSAVHGSGRFNQEGSYKGGQKKEVSSSNKLEAKDTPPNSDAGIKFGQGKFRVVKGPKDQTDTEQQKKEDFPEFPPIPAAKEDTKIVLEQAKVEQQKQETKEQVQQKQESKQIAPVFVEKVEPPKQEQQKQENQSATVTSQISTSNQQQVKQTPQQQIETTSTSTNTATTQVPQDEKPKENGDGTQAAAPQKKKLRLIKKDIDFNLDAQANAQQSDTQSTASTNYTNTYDYQNQNMGLVGESNFGYVPPPPGAVQGQGMNPYPGQYYPQYGYQQMFPQQMMGFPHPQPQMFMNQQGYQQYPYMMPQGQNNYKPPLQQQQQQQYQKKPFNNQQQGFNPEQRQ